MVTIFEDPKFGILPLICGTFLVTAIAMFVAIPIGLACAVFLSEYASNSARKILKPMLELLAGIPTIVYGFCINNCYAALQRIIPDLQFLMRLVQNRYRIYDDAYSCISI